MLFWQGFGQVCEIYMNLLLKHLLIYRIFACFYSVDKSVIYVCKLQENDVYPYSYICIAIYGDKWCIRSIELTCVKYRHMYPLTPISQVFLYGSSRKVEGW